MGEELDDRERLRRGVEEGGEVGGVEVHGRVAVGRARADATDAERPDRVRPRGGRRARRWRQPRRARGGGRRAPDFSMYGFVVLFTYLWQYLPVYVRMERCIELNV